VNQVSSVSATFTLKSALAARPLDPALEALVENEASATEHRAPRAVTDALAQGLSVKVNCSAWQRVLLRVDEESDEAIIIVFGLMPGRQYDVELGVSPRQEPLRSNFTTDNARQSSLALSPPITHLSLSLSLSPAPDRTIPNPNPVDENDENGSTATPFVLSTHTTTSHSLTTPLGFTPSPSPSPTGSPTLSASTSGAPASSVPTPSITLEDKVQQLNQSLSLLQSERDSLAVSLKTTRRDAQRADAAIRADIETLKRASDKFASVEHRARQKVLALQEAVKQTLAAAADVNTAVTDFESSMPGLREQQSEAEKEFEIAKQQATQARKEREALECQEKRRIDGLQIELVGLGGKLEKLDGKREKLENTVIPDLEEELRKIEEEIAKAAGPFSPIPDRLDDPYYCDPAPFGATNKSGSIPAISNPVGFSDDLHSTGQDPLPGLIENTRRRKHVSHPPLTPKPQPQVQKQVQILRPSHQQQARPTPTPNGHKPTATGGATTSTLSSLAVPFEPSPKRQAQLQSTLGTSLSSSNITSALKAELNSTANVFAPRMGFTTSSSSTSATPNSTSTSRKPPGASPNNLNPGHPVWSRGNQKPRRSDME